MIVKETSLLRVVCLCRSSTCTERHYKHWSIRSRAQHLITSSSGAPRLRRTVLSARVCCGASPGRDCGVRSAAWKRTRSAKTYSTPTVCSVSAGNVPLTGYSVVVAIVMYRPRQVTLNVGLRRVVELFEKFTLCSLSSSRPTRPTRSFFWMLFYSWAFIPGVNDVSWNITSAVVLFLLSYVCLSGCLCIFPEIFLKFPEISGNISKSLSKVCQNHIKNMVICYFRMLIIKTYKVKKKSLTNFRKFPNSQP